MPFGLIIEGKESLYYSPKITKYVLVNFPALPRIINKLIGPILKYITFTMWEITHSMSN